MSPLSMAVHMRASRPPPHKESGKNGYRKHTSVRNGGEMRRNATRRRDNGKEKRKRKRGSGFGTLRKLHPERIPEVHRIEMGGPALAKGGDQRCFPSARSADTPSLPKGPAGTHLRGKDPVQRGFGPGCATQSSAGELWSHGVLTTRSTASQSHRVVDGNLGGGPSSRSSNERSARSVRPLCRERPLRGLAQEAGGRSGRVSSKLAPGEPKWLPRQELQRGSAQLALCEADMPSMSPGGG